MEYKEWNSLEELARTWGINKKLVTTYIKKGVQRNDKRIFLQSMNVGGGGKPEYRIRREWAEQFFDEALRFVPPAQPRLEPKEVLQEIKEEAIEEDEDEEESVEE
jgi:hypothetical protein